MADKSWQVTFMDISGGTTMSLHVASNEADFLTMDIKRLKEIVLAEWPKYRNTDAIRLLFGAKQLEETVNSINMTVSDYDIDRNSTIHVVLRLPGGYTGKNCFNRGYTQQSVDIVVASFSLLFL